MTSAATPASDDDLGPILRVSQETGIPKRTLYRWLEAGRLKSRTVDGQQMVSRAAVRALAAARDAAGHVDNALPRAGTAVGNGTGAAHGPVPTSSDGATAAEVFDAFEAGKSPTEVVREKELPPRLVLDLWKQHSDLQTAGRPGRPSVAELVDQLSDRIQEIESELQASTEWGTLPATVAQLRTDVDKVIHVLRELPVPPRSAFKCECGASGFVETVVRCTHCGEQSSWGFQVPTR